MCREQLDTIRLKDAVLFDARARREYGPVAATFRARGPVTVEINSRRMQVEGLFQLGASFATDGNLITSDLNFLRIFPSRAASDVKVGILRLKPGADLRQAQAAVARLMPPCGGSTRDEFVKQEHDYWDQATPIGFIFFTAMFIAILVGIVVVHQILYAEISTTWRNMPRSRRWATPTGSCSASSPAPRSSSGCWALRPAGSSRSGCIT